jgi:hypothetical protein
VFPLPPPSHHHHRHHHFSAGGIGARSTLWYHKWAHIKLPTPTPGTQPVSRTVLGPIRHMQLKLYRSSVPLPPLPPPPPCAAMGWRQITLWVPIRQGFHIQTPHLSQGRNQCCRRGSNQFGTCSSNSTVPIVPQPPLRVGLALQIHPLHHKTRLPHPNYPHLSQGHQCCRCDSGPIRHMQLNSFQLFRHHHCIAAVGLALQIHPLVP